MNRFSMPVPGIFAILLGVILVIAGCGSGSTNLRVLHGSPLQSSVMVLVNGNTISSSLAFGADTGYFAAGSSSPHLQIELPNSSTVILDQTPSLSGANSTFVTVTNNGVFTGFLVADNNSTPSSGNANLRILNASPNLASADVYIVQPPASVASVNPTISGLTFQSPSTYQSLAAGTYEVFLTFAGTKIVAVDSGALSLSAGQIRTVAALANLGGGSSGVVLADLN